MFTKEGSHSKTTISESINPISPPDLNQHATPTAPEPAQLQFPDPSPAALIQTPETNDQQRTPAPSAPQTPRAPVFVPSNWQKERRHLTSSPGTTGSYPRGNSYDAPDHTYRDIGGSTPDRRWKGKWIPECFSSFDKLHPTSKESNRLDHITGSDRNSSHAGWLRRWRKYDLCWRQ